MTTCVTGLRPGRTRTRWAILSRCRWRCTFVSRSKGEVPVSAYLALSRSNRRFVLAHQRGAGLIIALLVVSVGAALAIRFAGDFQLGMARAESRWHGAQTRTYLQIGRAHV